MNRDRKGRWNGASATTGKFATRAALEKAVMFYWRNSGLTCEQIGKRCGVSISVVARINANHRKALKATS
jgi:transposase